MKKLVFAAACVAMGMVMAQESAPAPEAMAQEKCAIEEKDVDTMMDEFISSKGWTEGLNTKSDGSKFFIAKGSGVVQAPRNSQQYISSRVNAFNKAMLEAKKAMVEYLGVDIATETQKAYAEGSAVNPKPTEAQEVAGKLKQFLFAKINKKLAEEGIDPIKNPAAAKAALGKQLNSEQYKKMISTMARAQVLGFQACCTFEGTPSNGKGEIGVVAIWSPKLQAMAASIVTGAPVPPVGAKRPIRDQISSDPATLISTFGVQQKIDEAGDLVLVAFGQAGGVSESKMSAKAAQSKARQNAMAAIREFAGEQVAVATDTLEAESTEEFENGAEVYENESSMKEKIAATAARMNIAGIAPLKNFKFKHPINGKMVYGSIVTWCPKQAGQARVLKRTMANPTATSGSLSPNPVGGATPLLQAVHLTLLVREPMTMRSKIVIVLSFMIALSAFADKAHDIFNANRENILTNNFFVIDDVAFVVGRAKSPKNRGDAVGWTKAEASAKWLIGDRFRASACWPLDATKEEKHLAWLEYRSKHSNRFKITGMQRVWTQKMPPENYLVVLSMPASQIELSPPSRGDLEKAIKTVRERQRIAREEEARKIEQKNAEAEASKRRAGYREEVGGGVRQQQVDEDLIL